MARFAYRAIGADGAALEGEIDASSKQAAIDKLQSAGHLPINAEEATSTTSSEPSLLKRFMQRPRRGRVNVSQLTRELAMLLVAGLPLDQALRLAANVDTARTGALVTELRERVRDGAALSEALATHDEVFDELYVNMVRAGEASGALDTVFARLADHLEAADELRTSIKTALIYPALLFMVSAISVAVLLTFVVPKFVILFEDSGQALPALTQLVFGVAEICQQYWWFIFAVFAMGVWMFDQWLNDPSRKIRFDTWCLGIPYLGAVLQQSDVARFARTLSLLLTNGVALLAGVRYAGAAMRNRALRSEVRNVYTSVEQGQRLAGALDTQQHFPERAKQLIEIGEETGKLDEMLLRLADIYDREVETSLRRLLTVLEPVLILGLGGLIAIIIVSILMAMLGLNELVI